MNKIVILLFSLLVLGSCKNQENTETVSGEAKEIKGDFIYFEDVAVLKGDTFIYGVKLDEKAKELSERIAPLKKEEWDMFPVIIKGTVQPKPEGQDGWEEIVTITEIVYVSDKPSEEDIKIQ